MGFRLNCTWGVMSTEAIAHYAKVAWEGLHFAWVSETGRVINAKTYRRAYDVTAISEKPCPNCGELLLITDDYLYCNQCGYGCEQPYSDED